MNPVLVPTPLTRNARLSGRPHSAHHSCLALSSAVAADLAARHQPGPKRLPKGWSRRRDRRHQVPSTALQTARWTATARMLHQRPAHRCAQGGRRAAPGAERVLGLIAPTAADLSSQHAQALGSASAELWIACGLAPSGNGNYSNIPKICRVGRQVSRSGGASGALAQAWDILVEWNYSKCCRGYYSVRNLILC